MSVRSIRSAGLLVAGMFSIACDNAPTSPKAPDLSAVAQLQNAADQAARAGNRAGATVLTNGVVALQYGLQPSNILVSVEGETMQYQAIVVGTVKDLAPGDTAIERSLIAWAVRGDRTVATLDVTTLADAGSFSSQFEPASDPRGRAFGTWADLVRASRWVATIGTAELSIQATGHSCNTSRLDDIRCTFAAYHVFVDGLFRLDGASPDAQLPAKRIQTDARGVNGVLLARNAPQARSR